MKMRFQYTVYNETIVLTVNMSTQSSYYLNKWWLLMTTTLTPFSPSNLRIKKSIVRKMFVCRKVLIVVVYIVYMLRRA